jgi:anaphase-promoting complex subunit 1
MTLPEMVATRSPASSRNSHNLSQWARLTPRTLILERFFSLMQSDWSPAQFVEALFNAGVDFLMLETLPEALRAPFQEAIVQCQNEPPTSWSKDLLALVGREDVNTLLVPGQQARHSKTSILVRELIKHRRSNANSTRLHPTKQAWTSTPSAYLLEITRVRDHLTDLQK